MTTTANRPAVSESPSIPNAECRTSAASYEAERHTSAASYEDDQAVRTIISSARQQHRLPARAGWICSLVSALLWYASFYPLDWGPLAFLAPVPLLLLARIAGHPRYMYRAVYAGWLAATLVSFSWMAANVPMVAGWIALSLYMAIYPVIFLFACRVATLRLRWPLVLAAPLLWTGLEFLRAHVMTGFSWYYLAHTQWHWTSLIQISDLVGAYGVTFVIVAAAAAVAVWIPQEWIGRVALGRSRQEEQWAQLHFPALGESRRGKITALACVLGLLAAALGYGSWRLAGTEFTPGPRMALIQGNFPSELHGNATPGEVWHRHNRLTAMSVRYQPDFIIWPESAFRWPVIQPAEGLSNTEFEALTGQSRFAQMNAEDWATASGMVHDQLGDLATQANAAMLIGTSAVTLDREHGIRRYNSAIYSKPEIGVTGRYDKQHRVVFGEYIPFRKSLPFLEAVSPYTGVFGIAAGQSAAIFQYGDFSIAPLICFEDTVPHLVREIVATADRPIDVLVDVSNDGWFHHSPEQRQHLVTSLFRAVETRTPLARAANTGVSAVIDGNGQIVEPVAYLPGTAAFDRESQSLSLYNEQGRLRKDIEAMMVVDVPLDSRTSLYVQTGDWFAGLCGSLCCFVLAWGVWRRKK